MTDTLPSTSEITIEVTDNTGNNEDVTVAVTTLSCTYGTDIISEPESGESGETPLTDNIPSTSLPLTAETGTCDVVVTTSLPSSETGTGDTPDEFTAELLYTPIATASASATPTPTTTAAAVHPVKGYGGMCLDDKGNSSANKAEILVWKCSSTDQAQSWTFTDNELRHNSKCLNDQGDGGSGTHQILYTCSSASNDKWTSLSNGELRLDAHNGTLCLNDPRSSKTNGTQVIVYKCTDSANEKWSLP